MRVAPGIGNDVSYVADINHESLLYVAGAAVGDLGR